MAAVLATTLPPSTPNAVAAYLRELRPLIGRLTQSRQTFIHQIGNLMERVRLGGVEGFGEAADEYGREAAAQFRYAREQVGVLPIPAACEGCHEATLTWTDMLIAAADTLAEIGASGERARLREVQALLAESRIFSNRFRAQYENLVEQLRQRSTDAGRPPRRGKVAKLLSFGPRR